RASGRDKGKGRGKPRGRGQDVKTELAPTSRPCLAPGVRLHWDDLRLQHVLLVPEGLLVVNATGAAILELCDGAPSIATSNAELSTRYGDVGHVQQEERQQEVVAFLDRLANKRLVVLHVLDALGSSDH